MFGQQDDSNVTASATDNVEENDQPDSIVAPHVDDGSDDAKQEWQHPGEPLEPIQSVAPLSVPEPPKADDNKSVTPTNETNDLIDIKQKVLKQLSPLIGHLDQSPEEKFNTLMMMIQASDDQSLIKSAYETAQNIDDEKVLAQALLDIVNEINYFTKHQDK